MTSGKLKIIKQLCGISRFQELEVQNRLNIFKLDFQELLQMGTLNRNKII